APPFTRRWIVFDVGCPFDALVCDHDRPTCVSDTRVAVTPVGVPGFTFNVDNVRLSETVVGPPAAAVPVAPIHPMTSIVPEPSGRCVIHVPTSAMSCDC